VDILHWGSFVVQGIPAIGLLVAGNRKHLGWMICLFGQMIAVSYGLLTGQYGFVAWAPVYAIIYASNWLRWKRLERIEERA
jgi:hypothetical protein